MTAATSGMIDVFEIMEYHSWAIRGLGLMDVVSSELGILEIPRSCPGRKTNISHQELFLSSILFFLSLLRKLDWVAAC